MPAASTRSTLSRQWELLKLLPTRGPGHTSSELRQRLADEGHAVSKRTIERDLAELAGIFPLQCNDKSAPYGWYWMPGRAVDLPGIAVSEALTLRLVEDFIRPLMPSLMLKGLEPRFIQAKEKLEVLQAENPSARWLGKVASVQSGMPMRPPQIDAQVLEAVQMALLNDRQLNCHYYSAHNDHSGDRTLNPLGLVQRSQVTYLVATAAPHTDVRLFALHRMRSAAMTDTPSVAPAGFTLDGYIDSGAMAFGIPTPIDLKAWITRDLARLIVETPLSDDMALTDDGDGKLLTATVKDTWQLRWWALSHAGSLVVMEPASLREELAAKLETAVAMYRDCQSTD